MSYQYDINFLRFLTLKIPMSLEDFIIGPLFDDISFNVVSKKIVEYVDQVYNNYSKILNLYINIPYCVSDCYYCHCTRIRLPGHKELIDYEKLIIRQINEFSPLISGAEISFVCFGGGTPSLLSAKSIERILGAISKKFNLRRNFKINFEANPSSLSLEKLKILKKWGVYRLSLGVQSLDRKVLKDVNRRQSVDAVYKIIDYIKKFEFPYLNIDIMAGLPNQTVDSFLRDLKSIVKLKPEIIHVNPFCDLSSSLYYKVNRFDMNDVFRKRHIMILKAKELLKASGYNKHGFETYQLRRGGEGYQQTSYTKYPGSVLGLGIFARSALAGKLVFKTLPKTNSFTDFQFCGYIINKKYTMANFVILHLLQGLNVRFFNNLFTDDLTNVFEEELSILKKEKIISLDNGIFRYIGDWTVRGLFDYFSYTKIFFGDEIIKKLANIYGHRYNPKEDYLNDKYCKNLLQSLFILGLYYDLGAVG